MTEFQHIELLRSIRRTVIIVGLACSAGSIVAASAVAYWMAAYTRAEMHRLIESGRCECSSTPKQIHEQHVTLSPQWSREDTIREQLKLRFEAKQDDDMQ